MKRIVFTIIASSAILLSFGCMSYSYEGKKEAPVKAAEHIRIFTDASKIEKSYTVLGRARVSGYAQDVSVDRMLAKLRSEAHKCGASAILIVEQQLIPVSSAAETPVFTTAFDYDDTNQNWSMIHRDVDQNFSNTIRTKKQHENPEAARRVIRAEFLRWNSKAK